GKTLVARERLVDTLLLARRKHPAGPNSLDHLCARYAIDNTRRTKHGALLDAEILAEVYIELIGARQAQLGLAETATIAVTARAAEAIIRVRTTPLVPRLSADELAAHRAFVATLGDKAIWHDYLPRPAQETPAAISAWSGHCGSKRRWAGATARPERTLPGGGLLLLRLEFRHALPVQADEVHRVDAQRRETAIHHRIGDDLARKREQEPRAFDHHDRVLILLGNVLQPEH